ncbi:MAG TPA: beta-ketoacyl synthase N-terminal-like domain-containing protein [Thermoanaerobaculia bacterium]|nr:beta-ketoacyl synthase N-terminal-like domain-containing protein [Thermoanaerobaculia bacterium]
MRRVAITGIGIISAAGLGIHETWKRLHEAPPSPQPFAGPPPAHEISFPVYQAPDYELADLHVPERVVAWLKAENLSSARDLKHLIGSTALALGDAGLGVDYGEREPRVSVVAANESPGFEELSDELFGLGIKGPFPSDPRARYEGLSERFFQLNTFLLPFYLARAYRFGGMALFVNSACTSGLNALEVAAQQIRTGRTPVSVVAAADNPLSTAKYLWFSSLGLYSGDGEIRPFDATQQGTIFGDGGAAIILEDLEAATARNARIYAEYLGSGFAQDGWKISVPSPTLARAVDAIQRAFEDAGVAAADVDLVVPHGVGTSASDSYESLVLNRVFSGEEVWPAVTAFKPLLGHNLGGSALLELCLLLAAVEHQEVPPTLGHKTPFKRNPLPLVRDWQRRPIEVALKLTCGFAGYYGAALFSRLKPRNP